MILIKYQMVLWSPVNAKWTKRNNLRPSLHFSWVDSDIIVLSHFDIRCSFTTRHRSVLSPLYPFHILNTTQKNSEFKALATDQSCSHPLPTNVHQSHMHQHWHTKETLEVLYSKYEPHFLLLEFR